jgi:hypothetical protein
VLFPLNCCENKRQSCLLTQVMQYYVRLAIFKSPLPMSICKWTIHVHYTAFVLVWQDVKQRGHKRWSSTKNRQSVKLFRCWITRTEEIFYVILSEGDYRLRTYVTTKHNLFGILEVKDTYTESILNKCLPFLRTPSQCQTVSKIPYHIVACLLGNTTNNLWVLDFTLDLLDIRQAELQLIMTPLILL